MAFLPAFYPMAFITQKGKVWYLVDKSGGKPRWVKLGAVERTKAKKALAKYQLEENYLRLGQLDDEPILFSDLAEEYLEHIKKHKAANTVDHERSLLNKFKVAFKGRKARTINHMEVEKLVHYGNKHSNAHRRHRIICLRSLFKYAVEVGYLKENQIKKCKLPILEVTPPEILPDSVVEEVVRNAGEIRPQLVIMQYTGCRPSECLKLQSMDVNLKAKTILFRHTKTHKSREIPIAPKLLPVLAALVKGKKRDDFLFQDQTRYSLRLKLKKVLKAMEYDGVEKVLLKAFRKHAASKLLEVTGGDLRLVSQLLGHSQIQTTLRYAVRPSAALKKAVDLL